MSGIAVASVSPGAAVSSYKRRESERTLLHAIVREHLKSFLAEAAQHSDTGSGLPRFVAAEFERYLACGPSACCAASLQTLQAAPRGRWRISRVSRSTPACICTPTTERASLASAAMARARRYRRNASPRCPTVASRFA